MANRASFTDPQTLRAFVAVVREGNVSRAGDCRLSFVCLQARQAEPVVASAWTVLEKAWR